jgi:TonB-linked SusC/RagA family outer membrane protein
MLLKALCKSSPIGSLFTAKMPPQAARIMKLTVIILLTACMGVHAAGNAQNVSLSEKNAILAKVLESIKQQTGYKFLYKDDVMKKSGKVNIQVQAMPLEKALEKLFMSQPLAYKIIDRTIVLRLKEPEPAQQTPMSEPAPPIDVHGRVIDSAGNPLVGASVRVKGAGIIALTNDYGEYSFKGLNPDAMLEISFVGYRPAEISVGGRKEVNVVLRTMSAILAEVSIQAFSNGYQQISAERVTGSYESIKRDQIEKPNISIASRLIGTTAGMQVKLDAFGRATTELRGPTTLFAGSFNGGGTNQPLIVVDGFPIKGTIDQFTTINPNDVENITILKDAAASSIWGAKASNGVIVITTKKGAVNAPFKVDFSAFTTVVPKLDVNYLTALASPAETVAYEQLAFQKWGATINTNTLTSNYFRETQATVYLNENKLGFLTSAQLATNLQQLSNQDNRQQISDNLLAHPVNHQYNLSLSGGGRNFSQLVSLLAEQDQSNYQGTNNNKYALNYRTNASIFKWLDFSLSGTYQAEQYITNGVSPTDIQNISPYQMLKNPDGSLTDVYKYYQPILDRFVPQSKFPYSFSYNPIQEVNGRNYVQTNKIARVQAGLTFKIIKGLTFNSRVQYENLGYTQKNYNSDQTFAVRSLVNTTSSWNQSTNVVTPNLPLGGTLDLAQTNTEAYNLRNQVNFSRVFAKDHEVTVIAGTEISSSTNQTSTSPKAYGYNENTLTVGTFPNGPTGTTGWLGSGNSFSYTNTYSYAIQRFYSLFTNAAYTYKGKYTLSGSYRTDASNLITAQPEYRYSPFYSVGARYDLWKENFMKRISWLNRLSIRATYGRTGNVDNSTSPFTLLNLAANPNVYTGAYTATVSNSGNPTLTWEKTSTLNFGIDYAMFNNKLFGKIDVYNKSGTDLIAQVPVPSVVGAVSQKFNNAAMYNRGIEVTIGTSLPLKGSNIVWNGSLNASYNKNKVTELFSASYSAFSLVAGGSAAYVQGYSASTAWAYQYLGLISGAPMVQGPSGPIPLTTVPSSDARNFLTSMGPTDAPYNFGMTNSFKIYDFSFSFILTARAGGVFKSEYFNYPKSGLSVLPNNKLSDVLNGDPNKILTLPTNPNDATFGNWISFYPYFSYNYVTSSLIRLQEVNLTYNLPRKWLNKINMHGAQLIVQGNNLHTWLFNKTGIDPDFPITNLGVAKPRAQYTFGIKFQL